MKSLDLDVAAPEQVPTILRNAAERFHESAVELTAAWQDKNAGAPWTAIARELEHLADRLDRKL